MCIRDRFWGGISTFIWGALFGGWFGDAVSVFSKTFLGHEVTINPIWFDPLEEPMTLLVFSIILGGIHLFTGMAIQAYMLIKAGKPWDALFAIGFWYLLLIGLSLIHIYIKRTPTGRIVTEGGYSHFGLAKPSDQDSAQQIELD